MTELAHGAATLRRNAARRWSAPRVAIAALTGLATVLVLAHLGAGVRGFVAAAFVLSLGALTVTDLEQRRIPNRVVLPAAAIVLIGNIAASPHRAPELIGAALGAAFFLFLPTFVRSNAMGMGDVKLGLLLGAGLGAEVLIAVLIGSLAVWPLALRLTLKRGRAEARKTGIPFGPFLAVGAVVALLLG